ncbi:hydantoinase B/oxoprolinase family protein [Bacillus sp. Marseille-P3661]|uniref:hydantoinase B/oxoprolinase family protein n=1 Tax=Bacillus sp. Marseille-P3661 TaxID=1936234 RepID=UPI000C8431FD|nr:hydantoinase B/oxoprolinase family protein [Bacillus sp. Marseille-P3661]
MSLKTNSDLKNDLKFIPRNDPVTFEVLRHRLWQINDEQGKTIINISGSPVASEGNDFNVVLADAEGEILCVGAYIILHVSAISIIIKNAIAMLGEDIEEGDMYMVNDPWMGAGHQNDICILQPIFWNGKRIAWTASVIHQIDVGGPYPGSWNPKARSVFDEAPRYRYLKVVRNGRLQNDVLGTYLTNSRLPDLIELDLRAQIAAANVVRERLYSLIDRYKINTVINAFQDMLDYSQILFKQQLRRLPDGEWYGEDHLDHDGFDEKIYTVRCRLIKKGEHLTFDLTETDEQSPGFINCTYAAAISGVYTAVFPYLCEKIPWNAGVFRQIDIKVKEGTVHHAKFPAPVGFGTVHASICTTNATAATLGKMLTSSISFNEEAMANWSGAAFVYNLFGRDQSGEPFATMLLSSDLQGTGAKGFADGYDVGGKLLAPRSSVANVESLESLYPVMFLYRRRTKDSGGAGKFRGGVSAETAFTPYKTNKIDLTVNTNGVNHSSSPGISGGFPGGGSTAILIREANLQEFWNIGELPISVETMENKEFLQAKSAFELNDGDVFVAVPHGGGGYGDPTEREPIRVLDDFNNGLVSKEQAEQVYGVIIKNKQIDFEATLSKRKDIRTERLKLAYIQNPSYVKESTEPKKVDSHGVSQPFGGMRIRNHQIYCPCCDHVICNAANEETKQQLLLIKREVGSGSPWISKKLNGNSPYFELWEYICSNCGLLIAAEQHRYDDSSVWDDYKVN